MKKVKEENIESVEKVVSDQIVNPIAKELKRYKKQIDEVQKALEDVKLEIIEEVMAKLKATDMKVDIMQKLPKLLLALKQLEEESVKSVGEVRGQTELSLLETNEI